MRTSFFLLLFMIGLSSHAEEFAHHAPHMAATDHRQMLNYPPDIKDHALANMRRHLQALAEIMHSFANAKYAEAADIADEKLGMNSSGATGCRPEEMKTMSEPADLDRRMARLMPEKMRELGQNMHKAANEFAVKAREAEKDGKNAPEAMMALAKIPQQCVACHENYRMR